MKHAIEAQGLSKRFKTGRTFVEVLKSVDFDAAHGELTMVMGPSGSGKSTLVAALSGLLRPDAGQVTALDGENGQLVIRLLHRAAREHGAAVICVTHDPRLEAHADRVIHIEDGRILDDLRPERALAPAPALAPAGA